MARIRYLKPEFFSDEDLAELPYQARLAFAGLWCYADKAGRLEDRPKFLKAMIFPYDNIDMEKQLSLLAQGKHGNGSCPFIHRYEDEGVSYIQILTWEKHQKPHHTEAESKIPPGPPLIIKGMGMEKQEPQSAPANNREVTVKKQLSNVDDEEWLEDLQKQECYSHLAVRDQLQMCCTYFKVKGIKVSRQRFLNWLNNPKYNSKPIGESGKPVEKIDPPARIECKFCHEIHGVKENHQCQS